MKTNKSKVLNVQDDITRLYILTGQKEKAMNNIYSIENYLHKKEASNTPFGYWKYKSLASYYRMLGDDEKSLYFLRKFHEAKEKSKQ